MTTTKCIGVIRTQNQDYLVYGNATDGTELELKAVNAPTDTGKSIGDAMTGETINEIELNAATPSDLDKIAVYDNTGGVVYEAEGNITAAMYPSPNFVAKGLQIPLKKGYTFKASTSD